MKSKCKLSVLAHWAYVSRSLEPQIFHYIVKNVILFCCDKQAAKLFPYSCIEELLIFEGFTEGLSSV